MIDITKTPMVRVTWEDARDIETGWLEIKDILNAPLAVCQEVGWLIVKNEKKVVIMRSFSEEKDNLEKPDQNGGGSIAIPRCWVKKIEYLVVSYSDTQ